MRITNNYYDEVIYRYSRTAEALRTEESGKFDSVLASVQSRPATGQDTLLVSAAQRFSRIASGQDVLLTSTAQRFSHATDITGYDSLLRDAAKKYGAATCV